jgi:hypothetical protein
VPCRRWKPQALRALDVAGRRAGASQVPQ